MSEQNITCVNVFKSQDKDMIKEFTKAWAELINQAEKRKSQIVNAK